MDGELPRGRNTTRYAVSALHPARKARWRPPPMPKGQRKEDFFMSAHNSQNMIKRIVTVGMLTALFFVLGRFTILIGTLHISLNCFPIIIGAALYGPVDALIVGLLGELFSQLLEYGPSPTLPLWVIPQGLRGLVIGIYTVISLKRKKYPEKNLPIYFAVCILAALVTTFTNTASMAIDALLYNYYSDAYVFGNLLVRTLTGVVTAIVMTIVSVPVIKVLRKCGFGKTY